LDFKVDHKKKSLSSSFKNDYNKMKMHYEEMFLSFKKICKEFHDDLEHGKLLIENYQNFLNEIVLQIMLLNEKNMAKEERDQITININEKETLEFIDQQMEKISIGISRLNNIYFSFKEEYGLNVEQLLSKIYIYIKCLNKKEYQSKKKQNMIFAELELNIQELVKICTKVEKYKFLIYAENKKISKEASILDNKINKEKIFKNINSQSRVQKNNVTNILRKVPKGNLQIAI
jgi:hypothetical protein